VQIEKLTFFRPFFSRSGRCNGRLCAPRLYWSCGDTGDVPCALHGTVRSGDQQQSTQQSNRAKKACRSVIPIALPWLDLLNRRTGGNQLCPKLGGSRIKLRFGNLKNDDRLPKYGGGCWLLSAVASSRCYCLREETAKRIIGTNCKARAGTCSAPVIYSTSHTQQQDARCGRIAPCRCTPRLGCEQRVRWTVTRPNPRIGVAPSLPAVSVGPWSGPSTLLDECAVLGRYDGATYDTKPSS
jgi:hypothetical protein